MRLSYYIKIYCNMLEESVVQIAVSCFKTVAPWSQCSVRVELNRLAFKLLSTIEKEESVTKKGEGGFRVTGCF